MFGDGFATGLSFTEEGREGLRAALVASGVCVPAQAGDAGPGVDVCGRLRVVGWRAVEPRSDAHAEAAAEIGARFNAWCDGVLLTVTVEERSEVA